MADQVLYSGVACITDLMVKEGLINLDFADVRAIMREMGKAMMGTGEATGEKRAMLAAEAAIANPLLDEVSMRGARGLLISITGGNDLTLYEVDEAASRIRQEVDEDANIILGATFDESLDGIVRVSVVATGIDRVAGAEQESTPLRMPEPAVRPRPQAGQRPADATTRFAAPAPRPAPQPVATEAYDEHEAMDAQNYAPVPAMPMPAPVVSAPTVTASRGVQMQPAAPQTHHFVEPVAAAAPQEFETYAEGPFIPPAAETPKMRPQRMPQIDDLPLPAQKQIRAQRDMPVEPAHEVKRRTLLERLTAFGMSRQEDVPAVQHEPQQAQPTNSGRPAPNAIHAEYSKRPQHPAPARQQPLDPQGRMIAARASEDDQLEIPAFLRRQSS